MCYPHKVSLYGKGLLTYRPYFPPSPAKVAPLVEGPWRFTGVLMCHSQRSHPAPDLILRVSQSLALCPTDLLCKWPCPVHLPMVLQIEYYRLYKVWKSLLQGQSCLVHLIGIPRQCTPRNYSSVWCYIVLACSSLLQGRAYRGILIINRQTFAEEKTRL